MYVCIACVGILGLGTHNVSRNAKFYDANKITTPASAIKIESKRNGNRMA